MHEIASSPVYEQNTVVSSMEDAERALPATSVSGQASAQSRALTVKAQTEESSDNTETITIEGKTMMIRVEERAPRGSEELLGSSSWVGGEGEDGLASGL